MKRGLLLSVLVLVSLLLVGCGTAGVKLGAPFNSATVNVGWDAVTMEGLPSTSTITYEYGYRYGTATTPTVLGTTSSLAYTFTFTTYGTYVMCVRTLLNDSGSVVQQSDWACSDNPTYCYGGETFVDSFWPATVPVPRNLKKN
jgi:hypothetical protein